jgi:hypothetical protein
MKSDELVTRMILVPALVDDPAYRRRLLRDLRSRKVAPAIEAMLWHYAYGVPKQTVAVEGVATPIFAISCLPALSPDSE